MNDPSPESVAALAEALIRTGMYVDAGIDVSAGLDKPTVYAAAILTDEDLAPVRRSAIVAALLPVEELAAALHRAGSPDGECSDLMEKHGQSAARIIAALRERGA